MNLKYPSTHNDDDMIMMCWWNIWWSRSCMMNIRAYRWLYWWWQCHNHDEYLCRVLHCLTIIMMNSYDEDDDDYDYVDDERYDEYLCILPHCSEKVNRAWSVTALLVIHMMTYECRHDDDDDDYDDEIWASSQWW